MRISGLTSGEYATLVGQYNAIRLGKTIDPRLLERGYTEEQIKALKGQMKSRITELRSLNIKYTTDVHEFKYPQFGYLMTAYRKYSEGVLPYSGSLADQPSKIIEIFNTIESVELEFKEKEMEEQQARAKRAR